MDADRIGVCVVAAKLPPSYGGAEVAAMRYAERLAQRNDLGQVILIGWDREKGYAQLPDARDFVVPIQLPTHIRVGEGRLRYYSSAANHLAHCAGAMARTMAARRSAFDVVHIFNSGPMFDLAAIPVAKALGKKVVTETSLLGDDDPLTLSKIDSLRDYVKPKRWRYSMFRMADAYVAKSPVIMEVYEQSSIPKERVFEIPYSVDIARYEPVSREEKDELSKQLGLEPGCTTVLFVGAIHPRKGVHWLVEAMSRLANQLDRIQLVLAGPIDRCPEDYVAEIETAGQASKLGRRFVMTKTVVDNVNDYMKAADIFALPSTREGFPIAIVEAMASGLPVVASEIPEIARAQIEHGHNGLLFPTGDVGALESCLARLLRDPTTRERMGSAGRERAVDRYSTVRVDSQYLELYQRLLHKGAQ